MRGVENLKLRIDSGSSLGAKYDWTNIPEWKRLVSEETLLPAMFVVGNKIDLPRVVTAEKAEELAQSLSVSYIETSAETKSGIGNLRDQLTVAASKAGTAREGVVEIVGEGTEHSCGCVFADLIGKLKGTQG